MSSCCLHRKTWKIINAKTFFLHLFDAKYRQHMLTKFSNAIAATVLLWWSFEANTFCYSGGECCSVFCFSSSLAFCLLGGECCAVFCFSSSLAFCWSGGECCAVFCFSSSLAFFSAWKIITRSVFIAEHSHKKHLKTFSHAYRRRDGDFFFNIFS